MSKLEPRKLVPELRFSEFRESEGWNQKTVKDIFSIFQGYAFSSTDSVATGVRWLKIADVDIQKMNHNSPSFLPKHYEGEYGRFLVKKNDYVMALTRPILGGKLKIARVDDVFNGALLNQRVGKLVAEENSTFVYYLIQTSQLVSDIERSIAGSEPPNLSSQQIKDIKTYIPSDEREIEKISECLSSMDDLITANTQKLESLKLHKKGLMQKLFPAEGENKPECRFREFDGDWKECLLDDIAVFLKGKGISKSDIDENGKLPCIRYGELYTQYQEVIDGVFSYTNVPCEQLVLSKKNDVLIPASGETQLDIATASCILNEGVALGGDLNIIRTKVNGVFLAYYLNGVKKLEIAQMAQGISVIHLYSSQLKNILLHIPNIKEQTKIASCLFSIDKLIHEQSQRVEILREHKKGLMQRLFPVVEGGAV